MYSDSVPIRISRRSLKVLRTLKAEKMLEEERNVSDAEVVEEALEIAKRHRVVRAKEKKIDFWSMAGFIKGGPRTNATRDLDEVLYGEKP